MFALTCTVLRGLIDRELLLEKGKNLDLDSTADTELIKRLDDMRKQMKLEEEQKFYDDHKAELSHQEQVRLSEILISGI